MTFFQGIVTVKTIREAKHRGKHESRSLLQKWFNASYTTNEIICTTKGGGHHSSPLKNFVLFASLFVIPNYHNYPMELPMAHDPSWATSTRDEIETQNNDHNS